VTPVPLTWVVGGGGLLGRHVCRAIDARGGAPARFEAGEIGWATGEAVAVLERESARFLDLAAGSDAPWRLMWCAGAGVVSTSPEELARETQTVRRFVAHLTRRLAGEPALAARGSVFVASSAGGVYSASPSRPPFDEHSPTGSLGHYGREKLVQEELFGRLARDCSLGLLVARFSNLYGPGQSLSKPQGLISHVGRAALRREPVSLYVPLDTIRDYLFAEDAGTMAVDAVECLETLRRATGEHLAVTKIFASEIDTTVASVLGAWRQSLRRPLRVAMASNAAGRLQPRILSFRSRVWPDVRRCPTLLPVGVEAVRRDQLARLMASGLR